MAKFVCETCKIKQDVPLIGWHWLGEVPDTQHYVPCGEAVPDPNNPTRLTCQYGHDHRVLWPIHWECGKPFKYVRD